jgi:hypothetical protein
MVCAGAPVLGNASSEFAEGQHQYTIEQPRCAEIGVKRLEAAGEFIEELEVRSRPCRVRVISGLYRIEDASTQSPLEQPGDQPEPAGQAVAG